MPAPGKKGGRELAPVPGLPEGRYDCVVTWFSYRIYSWEGEMSMCAMCTYARWHTHLGFVDFHEILDIFEDKKCQIQL